MKFIRPALLIAAALLSIGATRHRNAPLVRGAPVQNNWLAKVVVTESGTHVLGNPDADVRLGEFISYTCPHCAHFDRDASDRMKVYMVSPGKLSIEIRHLVRDPVDLTAAMLANCGPPARFFVNHAAFMRSQDRWLDRMNTATAAQKSRWVNGTPVSRRRAIAGDFGFYAIMAQRGYGRTQIERCLADEAMARRLADQTSEAIRLGVEGTPSFMINGDLLSGTHDWPTLREQLEARMRPGV